MTLSLKWDELIESKADLKSMSLQKPGSYRSSHTKHMFEEG